MIFLKGKITGSLEPKVGDVRILGRDGRKISFDAILDTGFNEELVLPNHVALRAGLVPLGTTDAQLADGRIVREVLYEGILFVGARRFKVKLTRTASRTGLIGMRLLLNRIATFDLRRRTVLVEEP